MFTAGPAVPIILVWGCGAVPPADRPPVRVRSAARDTDIEKVTAARGFYR
jgi:hypothetical protein